MAFLSGSFGPTRHYPAFLRAIADVLPLTYLIRILRHVYLLGDTFWSQPRSILNVVAWRSFCWESRECWPVRRGQLSALRTMDTSMPWTLVERAISADVPGLSVLTFALSAVRFGQ